MYAGENEARPWISSRQFLGVLIGLCVLSSCGSAVDIYRLSAIDWKQDSIVLKITHKAGGGPAQGLGLKVTCLTCNFHEPAWKVETNASGAAALLIPEARNLLSTRLGVLGSGIDTVGVLLQPSPQAATQLFNVGRPLIGRVLVTGLALLFVDSTMDSVAATAGLQDELNIFEEQTSFFLVHHPMFSHPLYMRKLGVVRLQ